MALDDLRKAAQQQDEDPFEGFETVVTEKPDEGKLFGMTAIERMLLSFGLFSVTLVVSLLLLILTQSIQF